MIYKKIELGIKKLVEKLLHYLWSLQYICYTVTNIVKFKYKYPLIFNFKKFIRRVVCEKYSGKLLLEIGPFDNPMLIGENVRYFDVLDVNGLMERAVEEKRNKEGVPSCIHYVSNTGDLDIVKEKFSAIFSSHVIEHQPDFIKHLRQVSQILEENGLYYCIIPNKKFCFDALIPESNIAEIIVANLEKRSRHDLRSIIEHMCLTTHNKSYLHFLGFHGEVVDNLHDSINNALNRFNSSSGYIDVHAWYFTEETFKIIINQLLNANYIDMHLDMIYPTPPGGLEFFAVLKKAS